MAIPFFGPFSLRHVTSPNTLRQLLGASEGLGETARLLIHTEIDNLEHDLEAKETIRKQIGRIVALTPAMWTAMSVMGIGPLGAFALVAYIEDVQRFPTAKKLCSYFGFKTIMAESGKDTDIKHLSKCGTASVKALLIESAQSAMRYGRQPMHKWAWRLRAKGKAYHLAVATLARKMLTALWHALMGHPCRALSCQWRPPIGNELLSCLRQPLPVPRPAVRPAENTPRRRTGTWGWGNYASESPEKQLPERIQRGATAFVPRSPPPCVSKQPLPHRSPPPLVLLPMHWCDYFCKQR